MNIQFFGHGGNSRINACGVKKTESTGQNSPAVAFARWRVMLPGKVGFELAGEK